MQFDRNAAGWSGTLDGEWRWGFHGRQCRFDSVKTGAYLDVELCFGEEFGVLDPWFFSQFLRSIPEYGPLASLLKDDYHDTVRVLEVLHRHGRLQTVTGPSRRIGIVGFTTPAAAHS